MSKPNKQIQSNPFEHIHLNSMFHWYPLIEKVVPTPKTVLIPGKISSYDDLFNCADEGFNVMIKQAREAASLLGYPIFLRTDHTSNKHDWRDSCFVASEKDLPEHMINLVEFTECIIGIGFGGFVVREFLDLPHIFKAFSGLPVAREFRFFIKNGKVICRHPYWIAAAMRRVDCINWQNKLSAISKLTSYEQKVLDDYALKVSHAIEPLKVPENFWSVDFCQTKSGKWVVTDLAVGANSFHVPTCKFAPTDMQKYGSPDDTSKVTYTKEIYAKYPELKKTLGNIGDWI